VRNPISRDTWRTLSRSPSAAPFIISMYRSMKFLLYVREAPKSNSINCNKTTTDICNLYATSEYIRVLKIHNFVLFLYYFSFLYVQISNSILTSQPLSIYAFPFEKKTKFHYQDKTKKYDYSSK